MTAVAVIPADNQAAEVGCEVPFCGVPDRQKQHDSDDDGDRPDDHPTADLLICDTCPERQSNDKTGGRHGLDDHQRAPIKGGGLQDPSCCLKRRHRASQTGRFRI